MKIKNVICLFRILVIFLVFMLLASDAAAVSYYVVGHIYYGKDCLLHGGKKNCDGWKITNDMSYQNFVAVDGAELIYTNAYEAREVGRTIEKVILSAMMGALILGPEAGIVVAAGVISGSYDEFASDHNVCLTDPTGLKCCWSISWWEMNREYHIVDNKGPTGNILLNQPTNGDITINGSSWNG